MVHTYAVDSEKLEYGFGATCACFPLDLGSKDGQPRNMSIV